MSHGLEIPAHVAGPMHPLLAPLAKMLGWTNRAMQINGMIALLLAALVLTWSVITRYYLKWP